MEGHSNFPLLEIYKNNDLVSELSSVEQLSKYSVTISRELKWIEYLPENRFPTEHQVLQRFEYIRLNNHSNKKVSSIIDTLIKEISILWNRAYIPIQADKNIKRKLGKIIDCYKAKQKKDRYKAEQRKDLSCFDVLFDIKKRIL